MRVFAVVKRKLVVVLPRFKTMLRHPNINLCITGSGGDSSLIDDTTSKTQAIKRAKVFVSAVTFVSFHVSVCSRCGG